MRINASSVQPATIQHSSVLREAIPQLLGSQTIIPAKVLAEM
jgi:hypothetical protein